jgi:hypothetical protein
VYEIIVEKLLIVNFKGELTLALSFAKERVTIILRGPTSFFITPLDKTFFPLFRKREENKKGEFALFCI